MPLMTMLLILQFVWVGAFGALLTDYARPDSFDQEIYIKRIENPFMVYFDPNSNEPDGSDAEKCLITEVISKEAFRKMYPDADDGGGLHLVAQAIANQNGLPKKIFVLLNTSIQNTNA